MQNDPNRVIVTQMKPRERQPWKASKKRKRWPQKRNVAWAAAAFAVLAVCGGAALWRGGEKTAMTAGFEYDETLGRLQFVSQLLPESAMVFLQSDSEDGPVALPTQADVLHTWSQSEPWLSYEGAGEVQCCKAGEVMTVVQNRQGEYTVRVLHAGGYESLYSGLATVSVKEADAVARGQALGTAQGETAFELRRDGLSVLPVFAGS